MLRALILVQITLWAATIQAFYIWHPEDGPGDKSGIDALSHSADQGITLRVFQRVPEVIDEPVVQAARSAARLARKYAAKPARLSELEPRANTYRFVKASTPSVPNSAGVNQEGSDLYYFMTVGLGSAQKPMLMLLDSGAGTTWVMGTDCKSAPCAKHDSFGPTDSQTYKVDGRTFSINYGSGSVSGNLIKDTLAVAGLKVDMAFGSANVTSDDFNNFPFDGILGLSQTTGATDNFLGQLKAAKGLTANVFGLSLSRTSDGPNTGEVTFGATDPAKYTGSIGYTPTTDNGGDWAITEDNMGYAGQQAGVTGRKTYIDTGTSYAFGPPSDVAAIHKLIPGSSSSDGASYQVPCGTSKPVTITFSGVTYQISSKDWLSGPDANGICTSHLYGHEVVKDAWLLGDIFLKNVYTVFDFDQSRIGFASKPVVAAASSMTSSQAVTTVPASTMTANGVVSTRPATTITASPTPASPSSDASDSSASGLSGHETAATAGGTAVPETTSQPSSSTQKSPGEQLASNKYASIIYVVAVIAMVV